MDWHSLFEVAQNSISGLQQDLNNFYLSGSWMEQTGNQPQRLLFCPLKVNGKSVS